MKSKLPAPVSDRSTMTSWNEFVGADWLLYAATPIQFTKNALRPLNCGTVPAVVLLYVTWLVAVLRVSTSAQNGAMMFALVPASVLVPGL